MGIFLTIFLICGIMLAGFKDLKSSKIPNSITFSMMATGLVWHGVMDGVAGLGFSASGLFTGICIFLIPYIMGGMGAGDVKLMGAVGSIIGTKGGVIAAVLSILLGFVYALALLIIHFDYTRFLFRRIGITLKTAIFTGNLIYIPVDKDEERLYLKFGLPIVIGTMGYMVLKYTGSNLIQNILGLSFGI